jgi:hypothetical protein
VKSSLLALGAALLLAGCSAHRLNPRHGDLKIIEKKNDQAVSLAPRETMRVGIRVDVESATISCESDFLVEDLIKKKSEKWLAGPHPVTAAKVKGKKLWMSIPTGDSYFQVGENKYRGSLIVTESGGRVTVINELGIDDYLKGVLPREVTVTWPDEALKVQAVASRTYLASAKERGILKVASLLWFQRASARLPARRPNISGSYKPSASEWVGKRTHRRSRCA